MDYHLVTCLPLWPLRRSLLRPWCCRAGARTHKAVNDRANELALAAKKRAGGHRRIGSEPLESTNPRDLLRRLPKDLQRAEVVREDLRRHTVLWAERASLLPDG